MKRFFVAAFALTVFVACSQQTARAPARLAGTHALAVAGKLVFVTSTDRDELRVIDTTQNDFVRAPNPLEPLAIPVVETPDNISRDLDWVGGEQIIGQYVYAWSQGGRAISAVGIADSSLKEERRVVVNDPLTAVAARAPAAEGQPSVLYYATYATDTGGGRFGQLYRREIPAPGEAVIPEAVPVTAARFSGEAITSIAVLPTGDQVVISTQSDVLWIADPRSSITRVSLRPACPAGAARESCGFSAAVREVVVDARNATAIRVFGLLDESSCDDRSCEGIEAVDLIFPSADEAAVPSSAVLAKTDLGTPMTKLSSTGGLFTSLDLSPNGRVRHQNGNFVTDMPLMALASQGNGDILAFNAEAARLVDGNFEPPNATNGSRPASGQGALVGGPVDVTLGDGAARDETIEIVYLGELAADQAMAGDVFEYGGCEPVTSTDGTTPSPPAGCVPNGALKVRAGPGSAQPFVVTGTVSGYLGRTANDADFVYPPASAGFEGRLARYFHQSENAITEIPEGQTQRQPKALPDPQIAFKLVGATGLLQGDAYLLEVRSNFSPLNLAVNTSPSGFQGYFVPASVARNPARDRTYIAYPAQNAVLEMDTTVFASQTLSYRIDETYQ